MAGDRHGHIIYRYPNRKLYDTVKSDYVTLRQVKQFVLQGDPFAVRNKDTGMDETHSVLCQILHTQAVDGATAPNGVLEDLIREIEPTI